MAEGKKLYKLIGPDGEEYLSEEKGRLGGNRKAKIYGRLDCSAAIRSLSYVGEGSAGVDCRSDTLHIACSSGSAQRGIPPC